MNCQRCGGPTKGQNVLKGNHRHFPDCIAFLKYEVTRLMDGQRLDRQELERYSTGRAKHAKALREIAFWLPTVCYEHNDRRYCDIEDVYAMKRIAADARDERKPE